MSRQCRDRACLQDIDFAAFNGPFDIHRNAIEEAYCEAVFAQSFCVRGKLRITFIGILQSADLKYFGVFRARHELLAPAVDVVADNVIVSAGHDIGGEYDACKISLYELLDHDADAFGGDVILQSVVLDARVFS